jgi:hypothetical protein
MQKQPTSQRDKSHSDQQTDATASQSIGKPIQTHIEAPETDDSKQETQDHIHPAKPWLTWLQEWSPTILNVLVVAALIFHGVQFNRQWQAMQDSIAETQKTRELEYRAYVGAKGAVFVTRKDNPAWGDVVLVSVNTGRTPGREGKLRPVLEHRDAPPPDDTVINQPAHAGSKIVFTPSIDFQTSAGQIPTQLADILVNQAVAPVSKPSTVQPVAKPLPAPIASLNPPKGIEFGEGHYLYGIIDYVDIFDKPHSTKFCFFIAPGSSTFIQCPTFNSAN